MTREHYPPISFVQASVMVAALVSATISAALGVLGEGTLSVLYSLVVGYAVGNFKAAAMEQRKQSAFRHEIRGTLAQIAESYAEIARALRK